MTGRTVELKGAGSIVIERSKRARRISISVHPLKGVRVAVPYSVSFDMAQAFAESRMSWIKKHLQKVQKTIPIHISGIVDKNKAVEKLINRLNELSTKHGLPYNRVFVRNQKTRWGSCSANNNISLNIKLSLLPNEFLDYVLLHELVHTQIKNHSPKFWKTLNGLVGDAKKMDRGLNDYQLL
jgi:predicted metal-dependent hydrolase